MCPSVCVCWRWWCASVRVRLCVEGTISFCADYYGRRSSEGTEGYRLAATGWVMEWKDAHVALHL